MAQQDNELSIYRVSAIVGHGVYTLHAHGWSDEDALHRISRRLHAEGHHLFTLSILDRKAIQ